MVIPEKDGELLERKRQELEDLGLPEETLEALLEQLMGGKRDFVEPLSLFKSSRVNSVELPKLIKSSADDSDAAMAVRIDPPLNLKNLKKW